VITYCILKNSLDKDFIVVKTGFSILAFFFGPIWGLFRKLWIYSAIGIAFLSYCNFILSVYDLKYSFVIASIASSLFWGKFARDLYIQQLIKRKFKPLKHVVANSKEDAIIQFLTESR
tara:strand:- start:156 stop:509 length:354 start_codon:yes stop_codon:yes gene_type:complete